MTVDAYLKLPYTIEVVRDESGSHTGWFARVVELPGCMTQADKFEEVEAMIRDAMAAWIETALDDGEPIPLPKAVEAYSGRLMVRMPKSLHETLTEAAEENGVSLNAFVNAALGKAVGQKTVTQMQE